MSILGINVASNIAYLALVRDSAVVDIEPTQLGLPSGLDEAPRLAEFQEEVLRVLEQLDASRVRVLGAETTYSASYNAFLPRITLETLILVAAAQRDGQRMSRAKCRSLLGLPRRGSLASHADTVTPAVGPAWRNKRDLAALVALAADRQDG
jgi:hypothetical protein